MDKENKNTEPDMPAGESELVENETEQDDAVSVYVKREKRENRTLYIIVSVIIAFALWFYVIQGENPVLKRTFSDVSVQVLNRDVLESNGYKMLVPDSPTVSVTIEGKRSNLVSMQKTGIFASVDVSQCREGEQYLDVRAYRPSGGEIVDVNPAQLKVLVDKLVSEDFDIDIMFKGIIPDGCEAVCTAKSIDKVTVTGARSEINRIGRVTAEISADDLSEESKPFVVLLSVYDKEGLYMDGLTMSDAEAEVQAQLYNVKNVELNVKTAGSISENLLVEGISAPESITVIGLKEDIADITSVDTLPINLSDITETTTILLVPVLPEGIELSGKVKEIRATVRVSEKATKVISYPVSDIIVENLPSSAELSFESSRVDITVNGTVDNISEVTDDKLTVRLDASGVTSGSNNLTPKVAVDVEDAEGTADDITVTVSEK